MHLADVGPRAALAAIRARLDAASVPGLRYAETAIAAPLGRRLPAPQPGRVVLIAAWDDDAALDRFLGDHPLAERLARGWHVRLEPLRTSGSWSALPDLPGEAQPIDAEEPVAVLTLGRLRLRRSPSFFRTTARAERQAVSDPGLLEATGLARPPRLVATFSLWRTASAMRAYAYGRTGDGHGDRAADGHRDAIQAHSTRPFHHESAFIRFRPYAAQGSWNGRNPLASRDETLGPQSALT
jgi:hypothetical protein